MKKDKQQEQAIMALIVHGGDARSKAIQAIRSAKSHDFEQADTLIAECNQALLQAHRIQTDLIQQEILEEESSKVSLLMVHAQDHLMNAMTVRDLAVELIDIVKQGGIKND
ncbi:PTS lactose/cellobiose transporter subunit IIA [Streptococcus hyointestinalis]|uniref:PTS lactose/cellobiose transporter subunit IIA n=1 Tax=Streptococcus hyointestinalis TaxID=1337 RepID=UPI0013DEA34A|nr:PTS lactose/cellobiose transporter subunit IIA [Streptococcus hyointestinalis]